MHDDLVDKIANGCLHLFECAVVARPNRLIQLLDRREVAGDRGRVQADDLRCWLDALKLRGNLGLFHAKRSKLCLAFHGAERLFDHQVQDPVYPSRYRDLPGLRLRAPFDRSSGQALPFGVVGVDVDGDGLAVGKALPQAVGHGRLDHVEVEGSAILAGAGLARHGALDADATALLVLDRHATSAAAAFQQAGQEPLRSPRQGRVRHRVLLFQSERRGREILVDKAEVRRVGGLPLALRVHARHAPARLRVFHHPHPVPDDHAAVDRVQDDAMAALGVAVDGRCCPGRAAGRGDSVPVQPDRDLARFPAGGILAEDPPHDFRLSLFDLHLARRAELRPVAVSAPAGVPSVIHDACHASADLVSEVLQEKSANEPANADLNMVGLAIMDSPELDAREGQALVDASKVLLVAGKAIQGFHDDDIELPLSGFVHERQEAVSAHDGRGRARPVFMERHDLMACLHCIGAAERDLILDRAILLQVARKPGVDRGARHGFSPAVSRA